MFAEYLKSPGNYVIGLTTVLEPQFFNPEACHIELPKLDPSLFKEFNPEHIDNIPRTMTTNNTIIEDTTPLVEVVARLAARLATELVELVESGKAKEHVKEVTDLLLLAERYCKS